MSTMSAARMREVTARLGPAETAEKSRTLWRARLRIGGTGKDEFLFRSSEEFTEAAGKAEELLESSPSCKVSGAQIVAVERVARLWN